MGPPSLDRDRTRARVFNEVQMDFIGPTYHRPRSRPDRSRRALRCVCRALPVAVAILALTGGTAGASSLVIEGAGDGHGVGMSQQGARGYALHGITYDAILAHYFTGTTLGPAAPKTVVKVLVGGKVRRVPLERYVRGVVAAEMPPSWPAAALEAQAVASRTYALTAHAGGSRFDVYSDTRSQVYRGVAAETAATNAAVAATAGQLVLYGGKPAITYFFASSGGMTENVENGFPGSEPEPWLKGVVDSYETGPSSKWKVDLSFTIAARRLRGLFKGSFRGIEVLKRGVSPRILSARVMGSRSATVIGGPELAGRLGLGSTWAYFSIRNGTVVRPEADHSGQPLHSSPAPASSTPVGAQGGVPPVPSQGASLSSSGGTSPTG
jgi:SpoIID/LytB domain protein